MKIDKFGYEYSQKKLLGKGTYGAVYLCQRIGEIAPTPFNDFFYDKQLSKSKYCAIKSFFEDLSNNQGLSCSTLREVNFMLINNHKNIVSSHECFFKRERVQLVMDFLLDLQEIVHEQTIKTDELNRKLICYQITNGLAHLHRNYIIHRDLKPQNIFISREGVVKIGDFGMSKEFGTPNRRFTSYVCSKQYRAPELFLRTNFYTQKTDIWSLGCIFYYVYTGQSLFVTDNNTDLAMIIKIFSITGTPSQENWLGYKQLPKYYEFLPFPKKDLAKEKGLSEDVAALIEMCLSLDPKKRPTAEQLLNNPFFQDFRGMEDLYALEIENIYDKKLQNCLNNA